MALNEDGGCKVDWSWLQGQRVVQATSNLDTLTLTFESGLEWKVQALLWKGAPFLAFTPWEAPRSAP